MGKLVDLKGQRIGDWEVLEKGETVLGEQGSKTVMWVCRCVCGTVKPVSSGNLRNGFSTKCGNCAHNRKIDVKPGDRFNKWEIIKEVEPHVYKNGIDRRITFLCKCECGRKSKVMINNLRNQTSTQCFVCARNSLARCLRPYEALLNRAKEQATKGKHAWTITYEEFCEIIRECRCHYCHEPLRFSKYALNKNGSAYQLDRKDNARGYEPSNVVLACKICNYSKRHYYSYERWYQMNACFREERATGGSTPKR